jgi:hypothetical protein
MDEDLKPLLQEIASELRTRNDLVRSQQQLAEQMRTEMMSNVFSSNPVEEARAFSAKQMEDSRMFTERIRESTERAQEERREFRQLLLSEIRRLNENLERLACGS